MKLGEDIASKHADCRLISVLLKDSFSYVPFIQQSSVPALNHIELGKSIHESTKNVLKVAWSEVLLKHLRKVKFSNYHQVLKVVPSAKSLVKLLNSYLLVNCHL